jgi:hypothetical protein
MKSESITFDVTLAGIGVPAERYCKVPVEGPVQRHKVLPAMLKS